MKHCGLLVEGAVAAGSTVACLWRVLWLLRLLVNKCTAKCTADPRTHIVLRLAHAPGIESSPSSPPLLPSSLLCTQHYVRDNSAKCHQTLKRNGRNLNGCQD